MLKNLVIWLVIGLVLMTVFNRCKPRQAARAPMESSRFREEVKSGNIAKVTIEGRQLKGMTAEGKRVTSYSPGDPWLVSDLLKYGVKVEAKPEEEPSLLMNIFVSWFPMLLLIGVWIFFMRQMQGGGRGGAFSFGKSRARMLDESTNTVTFADVAGCEEAKEEVSELVDFLRDPTKFQKLGGRIPRGVLMVGNPGPGTTLRARAGDGRRDESSVLLDLRLGLRRDVRRRRRGAGARHVRAGEEARAVHRVHRRDRRGRPAARRGARRRQRRARADAQPAAGGDGRVRIAGRGDRDRRDQPARRARPGAAASRALRSPGRRAAAGYPRPRGDPQGAHAQGAARAGRTAGDHRARHARLLGRR